MSIEEAEADDLARPFSDGRRLLDLAGEGGWPDWSEALAIAVCKRADMVVGKVYGLVN
jgi:hypothetical protein